MIIRIQLLISFLTGEIPTIGISVGSTVLSMAGLLVVIVTVCVHTIRKKGSSYIEGMW